MRILLTLALMPLVAMMAPGQQAQRPLAADQIKLFRANRELLEDLIQHTIQLANADTPVSRAKACHEASKDLSRALSNAIAVDDADRVAELSEHLTAVLVDSLQPAIQQGQTQIPKGTQAEREFTEVMSAVVKDTQNWSFAIPATGKIGMSPKVRTAHQQLQNATNSFQK